MNHQELDVQVWAENQFGGCELGDLRRTRRLVRFAAQVAAEPEASTPAQAESWADLKAAYRLLNRPEATFAALAGPHWERTRRQAAGHVLIIGDTTHIDFGRRRKIRGASPVGDGRGQGFLLHSGLMVQADSGRVLGLAGGVIHHRQEKPAGETARQRLARERESRVWGDVIEQIGPPAPGVRYTHVFDRGGDNYEVLCRLKQQEVGFVIRAAQLTRVVVSATGERAQLGALLKGLPAAGTYELEVSANHKQTARTATVEVRYAEVVLPQPRDTTPYVKASGLTEIQLWVVEVREVQPPPGQTALRWALYAEQAVGGWDEALQVIGHYELRPLVEEFHRGLKSGCRLEQRQYETSAALEALCGLLSVTAVRLLEIRALSRQEPERPVAEVAPPHTVRVLQAALKLRAPLRTAGEFYRAVARLGGFLGRKSDGDPGWITLWRGWKKLHLLLRGVEIQEKYG